MKPCVYCLPYVETAPKWKFWLARLFGKELVSNENWLIKKWRNKLWVMKRRSLYDLHP